MKTELKPIDVQVLELLPVEPAAAEVADIAEDILGEASPSAIGNVEAALHRIQGYLGVLYRPTPTSCGVMRRHRAYVQAACEHFAVLRRLRQRGDEEP